MRIGIVSGEQGWHVRELTRAANDSGHAAWFIDVTKLSDSLSISSTTTWKDCDLYFIRSLPLGSLEQIIFRMDLLHRLSASGKRIVNSPACLEATIDKFATSWKLANAGIPTPATICCQTLEQGMDAVKFLGGDVVVKPLFGSLGKGINRIQGVEQARNIFQSGPPWHGVFYIQKFVGNPGFDIRAFVLKGKILAVMKRSSETDWRYNASLGAQTESWRLTDLQEELAIRSATCLGADIAGVDLIMDQEGKTWVLEVNGVPGWQVLERTTNCNIARKIIDEFQD